MIYDKFTQHPDLILLNQIKDSYQPTNLWAVKAREAITLYVPNVQFAPDTSLYDLYTAIKDIIARIQNNIKQESHAEFLKACEDYRQKENANEQARIIEEHNRAQAELQSNQSMVKPSKKARRKTARK